MLLAICEENPPWLVDSPHKWPVKQRAVLLCLVLLWLCYQSLIDTWDIFTHILQDFCTSSGAVLWLFGMDIKKWDVFVKHCPISGFSTKLKTRSSCHFNGKINCYLLCVWVNTGCGFCDTPPAEEQYGTINSSPPSATYMYQWTGSALLQVMACHLFGAKSLPAPMMAYCQLDSWEQISVKFELEFYHFH